MLGVNELQDKGFDADQINQILKIYEDTNIDVSNLPINVHVEDLRTLRQNLFNSKFSPLQENLLLDGLDNNINIILYANPKYSTEKMEVILDALKNNINIENYLELYNTENGNDTLDDLRLIIEGITECIDVDKYANPEFNYEQKVQIKKGLESKLDVDTYANPKYNADQMNVLYKALRANLDISKMANEKYSYLQMDLIKSCLETGYDITKYINTNYSIEQMEQIKKGLKSEIDVSVYAKENFSAIKMRAIRKTLEYNKDNKANISYKIFLDETSDEKILEIQNMIKNGNNKKRRD